MSDIVSTILLIHVYIFGSCALLDVDVASVQEVASVQRRMPHGNSQVNWVSYSLLCKHIHVLCFIQKFEQRKIIFVIHRSLNTSQNAVEYLHNKFEKKDDTKIAMFLVLLYIMANILC